MCLITIGSKAVQCEKGSNLYTVLINSGAVINAPCGGKGTCGKCEVFVECVGTVTSCNFTVENDISVTIPEASKSKIKSAGLLRAVQSDNDSPEIAVDIGTTTVVAYLIIAGKIIDTESALNSQKPYGDDVITRIKYTMENQDGTERLSKIITNQIKEMTDRLSERNGITPRTIVIVGNTVMLHLYANISPVSIGVSPFTPVFTDIKEIDTTVLMPSISGYVGADTVAAVLASGMHLSDEICLLIDIGTNGEIALGNKDGILTCAAAAGPAFEGAQISCGAGGVSGAVNSVKINNGAITYTTIDDKPPVGICGSGILEVTAEMLREGIIDETGYFEDEELIIADNVTITDGDIRQVQLAKAAIAAGVNTLLRTRGISVDDVARCYLAGGFGSYMNTQSACDIGLIPSGLSNRITSLGNAAGMGAVLWQISGECKAETQKITELMTYLELSESAVFNEEFVNCMCFE